MHGFKKVYIVNYNQLVNKRIGMTFFQIIHFIYHLNNKSTTGFPSLYKPSLPPFFKNKKTSAKVIIRAQKSSLSIF